MPLHFFRIPVLDAGKSQEELNRFLSQHAVLDVEKQLIVDGQKSHWAVCATTTSVQTSIQIENKRPFVKNDKKQGAGAIDYKAVLSPEDFTVYAALRDLRKKLAEEEGVPAYVIFTNAQLAGMVTGKVKTKQELAAIEGIGQARVDKHAAAFVQCLLDQQSSAAE